jgi:hypothetical protein
MNKSEIAERAARDFEAWKKSLPKCLGYAGGCDGDLGAEGHMKDCPLYGKDFATHKDAFFAGWERAIAESQGFER